MKTVLKVLIIFALIFCKINSIDELFFKPEINRNKCLDIYPFGAPRIEKHMDSAPIELCYKAFVVEYDHTKRSAIWSAEKLEIKHLHMPQSVRPKTDLFKVDQILLQNEVAHIEPQQYKNPNGGRACFDKGHMAPAQDFAWDGINSNTNNSKTETRSTAHMQRKYISALEESFYMSNIVPQHPANNQQIWVALEKNVRKWVRERKTDLYVITGPIYTKNALQFYNSVQIPDKLYKIIIDKKHMEGTAFIIPNTYIDKALLNHYRVNLSTIKKEVGVDFLNGTYISDAPEIFILYQERSAPNLSKIPNNCYQYYYEP